jgi:hypothetical protein
MPFDALTRTSLLREYATDYVNLAIRNIEREYPNNAWMIVEAPGPLPSHRDLHPAFFGSFDWHSRIEMFRVAVRLLRHFPDDVPQATARASISALLKPAHMATEIAFFEEPRHRTFERPYGWGWLFTLQAEMDDWDDPDGQVWAAALRPLSDTIARNMVAWLPLLTYPQRVGMHANTAFGLLRSLTHAEHRAGQGQTELLNAISNAGMRFFANDTSYPAHYEPSGADFLSAALSEAELMSRLLPSDAFPKWLYGFLPGLVEGDPSQLFTPAIVSDESDGQIAHLAGLNLSRAASVLAIANALDASDPRVLALLNTAEVHANASLGAVSGGDYMLEHWLAAYATLLLSD